MIAAVAAATLAVSCPLEALTEVQKPLAAERLGKLAAGLSGGDSDEAKLAARAFEAAVEECKVKGVWSREKTDAAMQYGTATLILARLREVHSARKIDLARLDPVIDRIFAAPESGAGAMELEAMANILRAQGMTSRGDEPEELVRLYTSLRDLARRAEQDFAAAF